MNLKLPILLLLMFSASFAFAQKTIKGQVKDEASQENLPGVTILVKGTNIGTSTDAEGNFSISVPNNSKELNFSYIGYSSKVVAIGDQSFIEVKLGSDATNLQEVVVNALGF